MSPALLLLLCLGGCDFVSGLLGGDGGGGTPAAVPTGPRPPAEKRADEGEGEEGAPVDEYVYNPIGKRDPFRSFLSFGARTDDDTPRTPLQKYEIDQYRLVGIIWGIDRPRALVEDPEGTGHVMEIGTYIGKNWGKVTNITATEVVVTEEYQTIDGELVVNNINLTLAVADEGERP